MTINRRSKFQACISFSQGFATLSQCKTVTAKQFASEYHELKRLNPNASLFVTLYRNGMQVHGTTRLLRLANGIVDEIELESELQ